MKKLSLISLMVLGTLSSVHYLPATTEQQPSIQADFDADIFDHISDDDLTRMITIMEKEETWQEWFMHKAKGIFAITKLIYSEYDKECTAAAAGAAFVAGCCGKRKITGFFGVLAFASLYHVMKKSQSNAA